MVIKKADFHTVFQDEGAPLYNEIGTIKKENFNDWITNNFQEIKTINSFEEVTPDEKTINSFIELGYQHRESQCHYSAKAINLLNPDYEYWTGFISRDDFVYPIVTHSFNIHNGKIVDFSRINEKLGVIEIGSPYFPHTYYGIKIPSEFVRNFESETFEEFSMNPVLIAWYKEVNP